MFKILIVEDEAILAMAYKLYAQKLGHQVIACVDTAAKALRVLQKEEVTLICMDITIKGEQNGISCMQAVREFSSVPVIFISAYIDKETRKKAVAVGGVVDFLHKPIDLRIFKGAVDKTPGLHTS